MRVDIAACRVSSLRPRTIAISRTNHTLPTQMRQGSMWNAIMSGSVITETVTCLTAGASKLSFGKGDHPTSRG